MFHQNAAIMRSSCWNRTSNARSLVCLCVYNGPSDDQSIMIRPLCVVCRLILYPYWGPKNKPRNFIKYCPSSSSYSAGTLSSKSAITLSHLKCSLHYTLWSIIVSFWIGPLIFTRLHSECVQLISLCLMHKSLLLFRPTFAFSDNDTLWAGDCLVSNYS